MHTLHCVSFLQRGTVVCPQTLFGLYEGNCVGLQKRMAALAVAGDPLEDFTMEEVESHNDRLPLWHRLVNAVKYFRVSVFVNECMNTSIYWCFRVHITQLLRTGTEELSPTLFICKTPASKLLFKTMLIMEG